MKLCSLDARSGGQSRPPPKDGGGKVEEGGRAQWKINQPPSLRENEGAWREHARAD
jgi:hypothetical protein